MTKALKFLAGALAGYIVGFWRGYRASIEDELAEALEDEPEVESYWDFDVDDEYYGPYERPGYLRDVGAKPDDSVFSEIYYDDVTKSGHYAVYPLSDHRQVSLGEQPHNPACCRLGGKPHLGPCEVP